jgi:uncharacterized protein YndB with AHSA1/START domain
MMPDTVRLHRLLATKPEKVYRAFIEADALAKWLPRATATLSAVSMWSSYPMNACATPTNSTTLTCRVSFR